MSFRDEAVIVALGLAMSATPALAARYDEMQPEAPDVTVSLPRSPARLTPYSRLFVAPDAASRESQRPVPRFRAPAPATPKPEKADLTEPTVVCGMTLIPVPRESLDPEIRLTPRDDTKFTIRALEPPICR